MRLGVYLALEGEGFDCGVCTAKLKIYRGCYKTPQAEFEFEGQKLTRCPVSLLSRATGELMALYQHYRKGFLLREGGLLRQPYKYLQAMQLIEAEINNYFKSKPA